MSGTALALRAALRAEWTKQRTITGPAWLLMAVIAFTVAISVAAMAATGCPAGISCPVDTTRLSLTGVQFGQAVVAILAVLAVCNEYSTGMIRMTLAAMPRRSVVLAAKTCVSSGLAVAASAVAVVACVLAARLMLPDHGFTAARGFPLTSLADPGTLRAAIGSVLYLGLIALLSAGVAAIVRDPAVAIGAVLALLYVFPVVAAFVGNPLWHNRIERYSPMAGLNIQATTGLHGLPITPWAGLGVLAAWAGAAILGGGLVLKVRDA
ncbi:MAG TPA: ABC transporter permease [Streptosporangiaceae bacterium]|nr:ABC transporter permease [Streptosporangiaceae bacterium]